MINYDIRSALTSDRQISSVTNINQYFTSQALESERYFTSINVDTVGTCLNFLPNTYCGFVHEVCKRNTLTCIGSYDPKAVVSLALFKRKDILSAYANKTPIMCVNVNRLMYTVAAFEFSNNFIDPVNEALDFLISSDIQRLDDEQHDSSVNIPPNQMFSNLLHILRSTGYERYLFRLAKHLNLNVDLVKCQSATANANNKTLLRYSRVSPNDIKIGIGTLTAVNHGDNWFVKVTATSVIN